MSFFRGLLSSEKCEWLISGWSHSGWQRWLPSPPALLLHQPRISATFCKGSFSLLSGKQLGKQEERRRAAETVAWKQTWDKMKIWIPEDLCTWRRSNRIGTGLFPELQWLLRNGYDVLRLLGTLSQHIVSFIPAHSGTWNNFFVRNKIQNWKKEIQQGMEMEMS